MIPEYNIQIGVAPSHTEFPTGLPNPTLIFGTPLSPLLPVREPHDPISLITVTGTRSAFSMLNCSGIFILTREAEFLPKASPAFIQNTGPDAHLKGTYVSQRNVVFTEMCYL